MKRLHKLTKFPIRKSSLADAAGLGLFSSRFLNKHSVASQIGARSSRRVGQTVVSLLALATLVVASPKARALPTGGTVVAGSGSATITTKGLVTQVNQSSNRAVIEWQSFNLDSNETVNFKLPNSTGATLNRITGSGVSTISGTVTSNGSLFFVNPNGLIFDANSKVSVNSFIATTADIANGNFMAGQANGNSMALDFNRASTVATAEIKLQGTLSVASFGQVAVFGPRLEVASTSIINASRGSVYLSNYQTAKLTWQTRPIAGLASSVLTGFYGVTSMAPRITATPTPNLSNSFIEQSGTINAEGGIVTLVVEANSPSTVTSLTNSGTINASDLVVNGILYSGSASLSAVDGSVSLNGGAIAAGGGGLLVNGATVGIYNASLKVKTLTSVANGGLSSKNAAITISGKTVTLIGNQINADSSITDSATTSLRIKSGEASINLLADSLTHSNNLWSSSSQITTSSTKLTSLVSGNSLISLKGKSQTSSHNSLVTSSAISVDDPLRSNNFSTMTVQTGNSSIAYVSDVFTYSSNRYATYADSKISGGEAINGAKLGDATTLLNLAALNEEPVIQTDSAFVPSGENGATDGGTGDGQSPETSDPQPTLQLATVNLNGNGVRTLVPTVRWQNTTDSTVTSHTIIAMTSLFPTTRTTEPKDSLAGKNNKGPTLPTVSSPSPNFTSLVIQTGLVVNSPTLLGRFQKQALVIDSSANSGVAVEVVKLSSTVNSPSVGDASDDDDLFLQNRLADAYARHFGRSKNRVLPFTDPDKAQPGLGFGGTDGVTGHEAPNPGVSLDFGRGLNQSFATDEIKFSVPLDGHKIHEGVETPHLTLPAHTKPTVKLQEINFQTPGKASGAKTLPRLQPISAPAAPSSAPWFNGLKFMEIRYSVPLPAAPAKLPLHLQGGEVYVAPLFNRIRAAG